jgi:hypothetical protein
MRRAAIAAWLAALALPASAAAQEEPPPPVPDQVSAVVVFTPLTYGEPTYVNGQLDGTQTARQTVALEESQFPFGAWTQVASANTDDMGYFSFKRRPALLTRWRVVSLTQNSGTSPEVEAAVAPRLRFRVSLRGSLASYTGSLAPAHDRAAVQLQRKSRRGTWTTVASPRLRGTRFKGRMRLRGRTVLRALFPPDGDHLQAASPAITLDP